MSNFSPVPFASFSRAFVQLPFLRGFSTLFWLRLSWVQAHRLGSALRAQGCHGGCSGLESEWGDEWLGIL